MRPDSGSTLVVTGFLSHRDRAMELVDVPLGIVG